MQSSRPGWIVAAVMALFFCGLAAADSLLFERETITVWVKPDGIKIEGAYTFTNTMPVSRHQRLYYPFPIDSLQPLVNNISVRTGESTIEFKRLARGIGFTIVVPASGSETVEVSYEQSSLDSSGCYILMSTAVWDAPLEEAIFAVRVPDTLELIASSYEFDTVVTQNGTREYRFTRKDFVPENDLCIRWGSRVR